MADACADCRVTTWSAVTWDTARAGGFAAYVLLTAGVSVGLVLRNRWQSTRWPRLITNELHGYLSLLALVFITVHVLAVLVDPFTRFGLAEVLVPFASHYRPFWMGLGVVALYLLLAVWVSSRLRARIGFRTWRTIHVLAYGVYVAATVHGLGTGSDTSTVWAPMLYAVSILLVGGLTVRRLLVPAGAGQAPRPVLA
ncbi:MAG TPA: ferric reductase-like transmembrane domain-containing protein, partial [Gaiellaceae bacterium]|nr:ferric reductase-like transmembrane domain-containing protein [Gaiellaceae bacterium]